MLSSSVTTALDEDVQDHKKQYRDERFEKNEFDELGDPADPFRHMVQKVTVDYECHQVARYGDANDPSVCLFHGKFGEVSDAFEETNRFPGEKSEEMR